MLGGVTLATVGASLLLLTEFPANVASDAGASTALAELAARSPGVRIGGTALKAKSKRAAPVALTRKGSNAAPDAPAGLGTPIASVLGAAGPETLGVAPAPLGTSPGDVFSPGTTALVGQPSPIGGVGFVPVPSGGGVIIGPGAGAPGGSPGGGTGGLNPTPTPSPTAAPSPGPTPSPTSTSPIVSPSPTPTQPPVSAVPEPATWLMLITGFGFLGSALRRRRRVPSTA